MLVSNETIKVHRHSPSVSIASWKVLLSAASFCAPLPVIPVELSVNAFSKRDTSGENGGSLVVASVLWTGCIAA